ncbi:S8 family serine peptidase, partial [Chloroflexota bacterium]
MVILVLLALLAQLVPGGLFQTTAVEAQEPVSATKISSLLALQVQAKLSAVKAGGVPSTLESSQQAGQFDILQMPGMILEDLSNQQIFIHFTEEPTQSQIAELEADNVTLHLDSWIPPLANHPTGFIIADMPVDKLETLAEKGYVVRLETGERLLEPQNDLGTQKINADDVWDSGYNGTGVRIAVLDSGLDVDHADIPTPVASKDYSDYPTLDDTIANIPGLTGHGTHVAGSVLGRGTQSGGVYKGSAPGADLIFLKIGNDTTSSAPTAAMVNAIKDAVDVYNADIITMSYGGWDVYHDGTSEESQAVDYAVSQGAVVLISAGNEANDDQHFSGTVGAGSTTGFIPINVTGAGNLDTTLWFNMVWFDGTGTSNDLSMQFYQPDTITIPTVNEAQTESARGTEARMGYIGPSSGSHYAVAPGDSTPYVKVTNNSATPQDFHLYVWASGAGSVTFQNPDPDYTISSPADADSAIAVGAYVTRTSWTNYKGIGPYNYGQTIDTIASFSSRGPRVDAGAPPKPNIVAPGSAIISARDNDVYPWPGVFDGGIIDNDGLNLNGSGPADYYVMQGTSMACPLAAGVAALMLEKNPDWTPAQVKNALESTATDNGTPGWDSIYGWGLIDALAALPEPPAVTTSAADNITSSSATLHGNLDSLGSASSANVSFEWGTTSGNLTQQTQSHVMDTIGSFSADLSSLSSNTTYYFRTKAVGDGTGYGNELSFATETIPPAVTTSAADNITSNSATLHGDLTDLGDYSSANASFEWGPTSGNLTWQTTPQVMDSTDNFSADLSSLSSNTTYYFRAKAATNPTVYGNELSFTTEALLSIEITPDSPVLNAGHAQQFTATGNYSDNTTDIITSTVTWSSSNPTIAMIKAGGLATSYAAGSTVITATSGNITGSTTLTVTAAVLDSVTVTPVNPTITFIAGTPPTLQFAATAIYTDGSTSDTTVGATWGSSTPTTATIGVNGLVTTVAAGTTTINATLSGITGNTLLTVLADTVAPVVMLDSPSEGLIISSTTLTVSGRVDDVNATTTVIVNVTPYVLTLDGSGNFDQPVSLNVGNNTVLVRAVDYAGNTGTSGTRAVEVNPSKPGITITSPSEGLVTSNPSLSVSGTVVGATSATLWVNGISVATVNGSFTQGVTLLEGRNTVVVSGYATDESTAPF